MAGLAASGTAQVACFLSKAAIIVCKECVSKTVFIKEMMEFDLQAEWLDYGLPTCVSYVAGTCISCVHVKLLYLNECRYRIL